MSQKRPGSSGDKGEPRPSIKKVKLIPRVQPTAEKRERLQHREDPLSPIVRSGTGEKLLRAAQLYKTFHHQYDEIREDQVRILLLQPDEDPDAELFVELFAVTREELQETYDFEALSYYWGEGIAKDPVFVKTNADEVESPKDDLRYDNAVRAQEKITMRDIVVQAYKKRLRIKPNLYKALRRLRDRKHKVALWVDAICIDQSNEREKRIQVSKMAEIYSRAARVCIWLGDADRNGRTDRAMDFISELVKEYEPAKNITAERADDWNDLLYLMRSSWFSRRWVIQELALAKDATVHCGAKSIHWRDLADAISLFALYFEQIRKLLEREKERLLDHSSITELNYFSAKILVGEIGNTFLKNADGTLFEPLRGLETLVSTLSSFETSDPRDVIHALLNMAKETSSLSSLAEAYAKGGNPPPKPDYSKDLLQVYTNFVRWAICDSKSLDIICRQWALPDRTDQSDNYQRLPVNVKLPSWIKVVPGPALHGRKTGDSFVGLPEGNCYSASRGKFPEVRFGADSEAEIKGSGFKVPNTSVNDEGVQRQTATAPTPSLSTSSSPSESISAEVSSPTNMISGHGTSSGVAIQTDQNPRTVGQGLQKKVPKKRDTSLYVKGFILSKVAWRTDEMPDGVIPQRALQKLGWKGDKDEVYTVPDRVWRTLVADRGPDGENPPNWYHRACLRCLIKDTLNGHINTRTLLEDTPPPPKIIKDYLTRVRAVTWNRVVLEAEDDGEGGDCPLVGLGPSETEVGDILCILFGCSVPCILRPKRGMEGGILDGSYEFIGEAFIYGKMDGDTIARISEEELKVKTVEFRLM